MRLRNAWIALRFEFPGLALVPSGLDRKVYTAPDAASVDKWANETFSVASAPIDADSILAAYPLRDLPLLYFLPESSSVLLLVSHWRVDGLGTCMLLDRLFDLLDAGAKVETASWTPDLHKLSPGIQDAFDAPPGPETVTPELERLAREYIEDHHRTAVNAAGLPFRGDASTPPGCPARRALVLTPDSTAALVGSCRARARVISVTSAVHAALAEVVLRLSPESQEGYAAVVSANMRGHLKAPYRGREHAVHAYVTGIAASVDRASCFYDKARHLTAFYKGWYSDRFVRTFRLTTQYHAEALSRPRPAGPPPSSVTLSSLGIVGRYLASHHGGDGQDNSLGVRLNDFRFGVSMLTRQMLLYVWTFAGQLNLSVNYNAAYHDCDSAQELLEAICQVLAKEMDISLKYA